MSLGQRLQPLTSFTWRGDHGALAMRTAASRAENLWWCLGRLRHGAGWIAAAGLAIGGLVLAARQVAGGLTPPAPLIQLAACATCVGVVRVVDALVAGPAGMLARGGLLLAVGALALPPSAGTTAEWVARAVVLVAAGVTALPFSRWQRPASRHRQMPPSPRPERADQQPRRRPRRGLLQQRLERFCTTDGRECLRGTLVIEVPAGARAGWGHIGFCPTFADLPQVRATTRYDEADVTVSAAEILPWGARIECRLDEPAEQPLRVPVTLVVRSPQPSTSELP